MEALLIWLLVAILVFGALFAVVRIAPLDPWMKQAANIVLGVVFLVLVLVKVLVPLLHISPMLG